MRFYKKYKPLLNLNNSEYSVIALTGGRGSLKTGHAIRGVLTALVQAKKKACFFRETKDTLQESVISEVTNIIDENFVDRGFYYTKTSISHKNGSYTFFKGLKEVNTNTIENLKGIATDTDFFIVDEAQAVSKAVWDALIPTLRKAGCVLIVIYNRVDDNLPVEKALYLDYDNMAAPEGTFFLEVNYPEIEHLGFLSKEFLRTAELEKKNRPDEFEEKYLNKPRFNGGNPVVKYFGKGNIAELVYQPDADLYLTCDFNVASMAWGIAHVVNGKYYFFDEICKENTTTRDCAQEFLRRYANHKGNVIVTGDSSGKFRSTQSEYHNYEIIDQVLSPTFGKRLSYKILDFNPAVEARIIAFNQKVKSLKGEIELYVSKNCPYLLHTMKYLKYTDDGRAIYQPSPKDINNRPMDKFIAHLFDAASYLVHNYSPVY